MKVLVTRPEPGAAETARRLRMLGHEPVLAPVLAITPRSVRVPGNVQAMVATSANAISAALPSVPLFAVGAATAARARECGVARVISAAGDAVALAALVGARCVPRLGPLLLLSGAGQGMGLAASLRRRGFRVIRRVVYVARPMSHVGDVGPVDVALFFSAASAHAFVRRWTGDASAITAIAISAATEAALTPLKWARIRVASQPNQDAMLALLS